MAFLDSPCLVDEDFCVGQMTQVSSDQHKKRLFRQNDGNPIVDLALIDFL